MDKNSNVMIMKFITIILIIFWIVYPVSATFTVTPQGGSFPVSLGTEIPSAVYVNDIDSDGTGEIVSVTYKNLFLYDTSTGSLQSISSLAGALHTIMKMPDPNAGNLAGDNNLEIVYGDKTSSKLYAWNSAGIPVTGFPLTLTGYIYSTPALADVDNDGYSEIAIGTESNRVYLVNGDGTIFPNWPVIIGGSVRSQPAFGDIDGDGELEIVVNALDNKTYALNIDGSNVSGWPRSISSFGVTIEYQSPAVGDIDNDGTDEVVVSASVLDNSYAGKLVAFNGDGSILWNAQTKLNHYSSPAIGNIDTDTENEIVVGCYNSVFAFEHDGTLKWTNHFGDEVYSKPRLKDITGDGISEVFIALKSGTLLGFYGDGTSFMQELSGGNVLGTPSVYDFDNDGFPELVVGTGAGYIQAWNIEFIPVYPTSSIISPNDGSVFLKGDIMNAIGTGNDPDGEIMLGVWSSDINGNLGSSDILNIDTTALSPGFHSISYTVYDRDGLIWTDVITIEIEDDTTIGDSGDSGGSGGGGFTGEEYSNINVSESVTSYVLKENKISFNFKHVDPILNIEYIALRSAGKITTVVEVLKNRSTMVPIQAPHTVYKNVNIFVGLYDYANVQNIRDAAIYFRVEKDWLESNDIDESMVILYKYKGRSWIELPTEMDYEDDTHVYYKSQVKDFSSFAISGKERVEEVNARNVEDNSGNKEILISNQIIAGDGILTVFGKLNTIQLFAGLLAFGLSLIILTLIFKNPNN
ncbi:MAG: PGF-pre-PGF domain-containing protein [ANME-2 cluster archaeon]|nr:PGF-pre-PGF domain-containing protein [ANME-2 cluster archaeon]